MILEEVNKFVGVLVALIGSAVVAPGALRHLWTERLAPWGLMAKSRVRGFLSRFIPRLRQHRSVDLWDNVEVSDGITTSVSKSVSTSWHVGSSEMMIVQVQKRVDELAQMVNQLDDKTNQVRYELEQRLFALQNQTTGKLTELGAELEKDRRQEVEVNANGLPLIGFGIVLSGIPDWLARLPYGLGWLLPALALLLTAVITWPGLKRRMTKR